MSTIVRSRRLVPSLLALAAFGSGVSAADPTVTILSPSTGATGSGATVVFKVDWGTNVGGFDALDSGYDAVTTTTLGAAIASTTATTLTLSSGTGVANGTILVVGTEVMLVTDATAPAAPVVTRGYQGSTAATASNGALVTIHNWTVGDVIAYQALSTLLRATPNPVTNYNLDALSTTANDGCVRTDLATSNIDVSTNDRLPSAQSTVYTVTLDGSADQLYLQLPASKAFTLDSSKTASPSGSGAYNAPVLIYQKLPGSPQFSHLDVALPISTGSNAYDGSTSPTPTVNFQVNIDDNEATATDSTRTLTADIDASQTSITFTGAVAGAVANSTVLQLGSEQMLVTDIASAPTYTVVRGYNGTTGASATAASTPIIYKTAAVLNPKIGSSLSWTAQVRDDVSGNIVGSTTFTKKGSIGNVSNNTLGRQTISVPVTTPLAAGQHTLTVEILDGAAQTVATSGGTNAPTGQVVIWDAPTLTVNGSPMTVGATTQVQRSNSLIFTGSRFNSVADSRKSVISLKVDGGLPATTNFVSTTLGAAIANGTVTTITVASNTNISVGTILYIENEQLKVTAVNSTTITVVRGANGTTAAAHSNGTAITGTSVDTTGSLSATAINASTTLSAAITSTTATSVPVTSATGIDVGSVAVVGSEKMLVTAVSGNTLTVTRGYAGSTAATAINGAALTVAAANTSFRFDLTKLPVASKHVLTLTQTYDADNGNDVDGIEPQIVQTYYLDTSTIVDSTAPAVPTITSPADTASLTALKPAITGLAEPGAKIKVVATATDGSGTVTLNYPVTADATTGAFSIVAADWTTAGVTLVAGKTYTFQVQSKDAADNESALSDSSYTVAVPAAVANAYITPTSANVTSATDGSYWAKGTDIDFTVSFKDLSAGTIATPTLAGLAHSGQVATTLSAAITLPAATTFSATSAAAIAVGSVLTIDSEMMVVSAVSGTTVTVSRGAFGTTAAAHSNGAAITGSTGPYSDFTISAGASIKDVAISGNNVVVKVAPATATSVSLSLAAGAFTVNTYDNQAVSAVTVSRDTVVPTVTVKVQPTTGTSTAAIGTTFQVVLTASEPIYAVDTAQVLTFALTGVGAAWTLGTPTSTVSADKKTVTLSYAPTGITAPATVALTTIPAGLVKDVALNANASTPVTGQSRTWDNTAATCAITSTAATIGKISPIPFLFTFTESVVDFDKSKILITNGVLQSITGTGAAYTVNVMPGEGPTAVKVEFASGATITDTVGKVSGSLSTGGSGVSWLSRTYDTTTPRVISLTSSTPAATSTDAKPTNKTSIPCSIVFSESLSTTSALTAAAFTVENGSISGLSGSGSAYTFNVDVTNPVSEPEKKVRVVLQAGKVQDSAGNTNSSVAVLVRNFDGKVPTLTFSTPVLGGATAAAADSTAKFTIAVDGTSINYASGDVFLSKLDITKLGVSEGVIATVVAKDVGGSTLTSDSAPIATIEVNLTGINRAPGNVVTLSVGAGLVKDRAGNSSAATSKDLVVPGAG